MQKVVKCWCKGGLQKVRWRLLALGCAEVTSCCPLRSVPGMASESSVELGLTAKSDALQHHLTRLEICKMHADCMQCPVHSRAIHGLVKQTATKVFS